MYYLTVIYASTEQPCILISILMWIGFIRSISVVVPCLNSAIYIFHSTKSIVYFKSRLEWEDLAMIAIFFILDHFYSGKRPRLDVFGPEEKSRSWVVRSSLHTKGRFPISFRFTLKISSILFFQKGIVAEQSQSQFSYLKNKWSDYLWPHPWIQIFFKWLFSNERTNLPRLWVSRFEIFDWI